MGGLVRGLLDFLLGKVLLGEVAEGRVRVLGGVLVFPGFVGLVGLLAEDVFELVFAWVRRRYTESGRRGCPCGGSWPDCSAGVWAASIIICKL
jgi:hypothetical protein